MNDFFHTFKKEARLDKLSQSEKQGMRMRLYEMMERLPAAEQEPAAPSHAVQSFYYSQAWMSPRYLVPVAAIVLVVLGSGTAYAAQSALPGQPLYAIKINVTEPVQVALATTPQAKAEVNASIAQTRLEEAETLASQGTLTASTSAQLAQNFDEHAQAAQAITQNLASSNPAAAAQLSADFDSSLSAHDTILSQIASTSMNTTSRIDADNLAMRVRGHEPYGGSASVPAALSARSFAGFNPGTATSTATTNATSSRPRTAVVLTARLASSTSASTSHANESTSTQMSVTLSLQANASTTLAQAQSDFAAIQSSLTPSDNAQTESAFGAINTSMSAGATALQSGDTVGAKADFEEALRAAVRLDAFLDAAQNINRQLLPELLDASTTPVTSVSVSTQNTAVIPPPTPPVPLPVSVPAHLGL